MSKVSIIVPIYNVEKYLERCLSSIYNQTYTNFEVFLVDDGSTDNSSGVAKLFSNKDERFHYLWKKNGGLSSARNAALERVTGDLVLFVDGDDAIEKNCLESLLTVQETTNADIVLFPFSKFYGDTVETCNILPSKLDMSNLYGYVHQRIFGLTNEQLGEPLTSERLNTAWGKLYSFDKIKNFRFTDTKIIGSEDVYYNAQVFGQPLKVAYCSSTRYLYRKDNDNSLTTIYNEFLSDRHHRLYQKMYTIIDKNQLEHQFIESLNNRVILNLFPLIANIVNSDNTFTFKKSKINELLSKKIYTEKFIRFNFYNLPTLWKLFYFMCRNKNVYGIIWMVRFMYIVRKLRHGK